MTQAWNLSQLANKVNSSGQLDASAGLVNATPVVNGGTSLTTLTANNVILGNGTSAPTFVAPGTSGNVLTSNGITWQSSVQTGLILKLITDSTDIALVTAGSATQSSIGSTFTVTIPSNGIIRLASFAGRILNDATATNHTQALGIRIGSTNYWFSGNNANGTITINNDLSSGLVANGYFEKGGVGSAAASPMSSLDVAGSSIPTGTQTVQLIAGNTAATATLKGTVKQTRVFLEIEG
jgi:hypothetical protein